MKSRQFFERKFQLTEDMSTFLAQKSGGEWTWDRQKYKLFDSSIGSYREGFGNMWSFFFHKYDNGLRGIEWFLEEKGKKYSPEDREMLEKWKAMKVSCFQMVDLFEQGTVIEDIWSGERYRMPYCETMDKLPPWSIAVGMIEPYVKDWCIHGAMMWGHPDIKAEVMSWVRRMQEKMIQAYGRRPSPAELIADNYPEIINMNHRLNSELQIPIKSPEDPDTKEQIFVTHKYTCEDPELLEDMLLDNEDEFILSPGTDPEAGIIVISRAEKLDSIFDKIPADRRERLGLDEIEISLDLGNIVIEGQEVTASGWWGVELESMLELLESKMAPTIGLNKVDERRESHQVPKGIISKGYNIITDKNLTEQEVSAYGSLPQWIQWFYDEQDKFPEESAEVLVRRREYEQYRINPKIQNLNLLRIALGLPESPFVV